MKRATLMATLALGLSSVACGTNGVDTADSTQNELPPLTAEEQAARDNLEKNTLAEIDLPEGKMTFVEVEPGLVMIMRDIRIGSHVTRVEGDSEMTLPQIFRAYAPEREVPRELIEAEARVKARAQAEAQPPADERARHEAQTPVVASGPPEISMGTRPAPSSSGLADGTERVTSALASSIDEFWFRENFCHVIGADHSWCWPAAGHNSSISWSAHGTRSITCGDTGAASVIMYRNGASFFNVGVAYGQCKYSGIYHGPHNWLGFATNVTLKWVVNTANSVRHAGWYAQGDNFIGNF
jgi:hypothetical protein